MKKTITIGCLLGTLFIFLLVSNFFSAVLLFLIAGQIPGLNYSVPPHIMLVVIGAVSVSLLTLFVVHTLSIHKSTSSPKTYLPKRRFRHI